MNYHVIFDASQNGSQLALYALIPVFALLLALIGWALKDSDDSKEAFTGKFFLLLSAVGFAFSLVLLIGNYSEYYRARRALQTGDYQVVEGTVENFVPMPPGGHSTESFNINNTSFRYGSGWGSIVFNSEWNHGYIHNVSKSESLTRMKKYYALKLGKNLQYFAGRSADGYGGHVINSSGSGTCDSLVQAIAANSR